MLDCPEASQTSPTSTSVILIVFLPCTVISSGPTGAFARFKSSRHFPSALAVASTVWPFNATLTFSPAAAQPQTGTLAVFCRTM